MKRPLYLLVALLLIASGTLYGQKDSSAKARGALVLTYVKRPVLPPTEGDPTAEAADELYLLYIIGNQAAATLQRCGRQRQHPLPEWLRRLSDRPVDGELYAPG